MSHTPPAIAYASAPRSVDSFWSLLRLGLIVWSSIVLVRHASYWLNYFVVGNSPFAPSTSEMRAMSFASIECVLLTVMLVTAIASPVVRRQRLAVLAGAGGAFIVIVLVGAALDSVQLGFEARNAVRQIWAFATRAQNVVLPLLCVVAFIRHRD